MRPAPDEATWRALSPDARTAFLVAANEALSAAEGMTEGRPHQRAKSRAVDLLGLHFRALGRAIYVAEDLSVVYPGALPFSPDLLAVVDVPQPDDDERLAWVVADEGRGPDWVLEVLHRGDRQKDLVRNVERYARLGIPERFVYDRAEQRVLGHRLLPGARRDQRIVPQAGRHGRPLARGARRAPRGGVRGPRGARAELRARVLASDDPAALQRWLLRALTVARAEDVVRE